MTHSKRPSTWGTPLLALVVVALGLLLACESSVDRRTRESGLEMWAHPSNEGWMITFAGIRGYGTDVVVRFGDDREETFRRPNFQLPSDIKGPIDVWLLEYKLRGKTHRGPFRFRFDPEQAHIKVAKDALDMLQNEWVEWKRSPADGDTDTLYVGFMTRYTCAFDRIEYGFGEEPNLELPLPECKGADLYWDWEYTALSFPANERSHVVVRITYADGEQTPVHRFSNQNYSPDAPKSKPVEDDTDVSPTSPEPPRALLHRLHRPTLPAPPRSGQSAAPEHPLGDPKGSPELERLPTASTYAEAAAILEPCWRMLADDLPIRTAQRCRMAYDRTIEVADADGGRLAASLRGAAEVGRAWNDADAGLVVRPAPTADQRQRLFRNKRAAYRRELALLQDRTTALSDFAHHVMDEVADKNPCDRKRGLLLHALEALPIEFDAASMLSAPEALAGLAAATTRARTALNRSKEACASLSDGAQFMEHADKMIKDAIELALARREHSRCVPGRLHEVCARPGGLAPHHRAVLLAAVRVGTEALHVRNPVLDTTQGP